MKRPKRIDFISATRRPRARAHGHRYPRLSPSSRWGISILAMGRAALAASLAIQRLARAASRISAPVPRFQPGGLRSVATVEEQGPEYIINRRRLSFGPWFPDAPERRA